MRLRDILFFAAAVPTASAARQRVVAHSAGSVEMTTPSSNMSDFTETITKPPPPLQTVVPDRPALEASMMGLIVFSAAGLVLL
ncbi:hypothetical protein SAMD00023353_0500550 [Rosellinia necatrix]|uniref:Uncharacterized protein n=1 Tax=Rosellinia necatrix TaxID=77044 RepID=A0A1S8A5H1_ROSNE|nr:hypothetical protein SAMD00023353_0500550 [Rosellinia necatrix]